MSAVDKFKNASANFSERGKRLMPCGKTEIVSMNGKSEEKFVYERPALYRVKVIKCTYFTSPRDKSEYYIADFEVVQSSNPDVPVGSKRNWMKEMTGKNPELAQKQVTEFVLAGFGLEKASDQVKEIDAAGKLPELMAASILDPTDPMCKNALKDRLIDIEVTQDLSKGGNLYIKSNFSPVKEEG